MKMAELDLSKVPTILLLLQAWRAFSLYKREPIKPSARLHSSATGSFHRQPPSSTYNRTSMFLADGDHFDHTCVLFDDGDHDDQTCVLHDDGDHDDHTCVLLDDGDHPLGQSVRSRRILTKLGER